MTKIWIVKFLSVENSYVPYSAYISNQISQSNIISIKKISHEYASVLHSNVNWSILNFLKFEFDFTDFWFCHSAAALCLGSLWEHPLTRHSSEMRGLC